MLALRSLSCKNPLLLQLKHSKAQSARVSRRFLSNNPPSKTLSSTGIQPPRVVRSFLVGSAVGLATPFYVIVGIGRIWYSYLPKTSAGQVVKFLTGSLIGGGSVVLVSSYVWPFMKNNSDIVLPFAISNGISAAFWYTVIESMFGLKKMMQPISLSGMAGFSFSSYIRALPFAGASVGLLTALTTPLLWPLMFETFWSEDLRNIIIGSPETQDKNGTRKFFSSNWLVDLYANIALPVCIPVGIFSGSIMHVVMKPVVVGVKGTPWTRTSAPALASIIVLATSYFYLFKTDWFWEERMDMVTGEMVSLNFKSHAVLHDGGSKARSVTDSRETAHLLATVRDLWNYFVDFGSDSDEEREEKKDDKASKVISSYKLGYERSQLLPLVDRLIRLQHLDNEILESKDDERDKALQTQKEALLLDTKESEMASDLSQVLTNTKLLMMLQHTSKDNTNKTDDAEKLLKSLNVRQVTADQQDRWNYGYKNEKRDKKHFLKTMRKKWEKDLKKSEAAERMQVLHANIDVFQQELQRKLGYDIEKDNSLKADLNNFERRESNNKIMRNVLVSLSIVGGIALTLMGTQRHNK